MAQYSISDLEKLTGVKAHTLRIWEKRYGLCKPTRDGKNVRRYGDEDLQYLIKVSHLNEQGHKISTIAGMDAEELDLVYKSSVRLGDSGCCMLDKLTLALQKTQETRLYTLLQERLNKLGIQVFVSKIWEPMQERIGFLILSAALHKIHLRLFDQIVERLLEAENIDAMTSQNVCNGSALLVNTCGKSTSVFHQLTKRYLIEHQVDVLSLTLCQSDWGSLESILQNRTFDHIFIHYKAKEFQSLPEYGSINQWVQNDARIIIYGSESRFLDLPERWTNMKIDQVLTYIDNAFTYNPSEGLVTT